jgi:uncharacterized membrane protein
MGKDLMGEKKEEAEGEARGIERVDGFSDAVFAVAITLLILTLDVPAVSDMGQLPSELKALWPKFQGFLISFVIIGAFCTSHHTVFRYSQFLYLLLIPNAIILEHMHRRERKKAS